MQRRSFISSLFASAGAVVCAPLLKVAALFPRKLRWPTGEVLVIEGSKPVGKSLAEINARNMAFYRQQEPQPWSEEKYNKLIAEAIDSGLVVPKMQKKGWDA